MMRVSVGTLRLEVNVANYTRTTVQLSASIDGLQLRAVYAEEYPRPRLARRSLVGVAELLARQIARALIDRAELVFDHIQAQAPMPARERLRRLTAAVVDDHDPIRARWAS